MKTKFKRISKSALSVVLALMMVISTMLVGIVTVGAVDAVADGYYRVLFIKSTSTSSFYTVKLNYDNNNSNWTNSQATYIGEYNSNHVYYLDVPSRINSTATKIEVNDGSSNYKDMVSTAKGNIKDGYIFKIDSNGNVTCENPKEVSNFNVSSETVEIGSSVTLSASYTSVITSDVTYTYTDQDGNVLLSTTSTSDTWTPSSAGTYTITCKASDGYITKTSTTTKTVTVTNSGGSESNTELYVLSKFSSDVKLYTYDLKNFTPKDSSLTDTNHLPMNMVASFQDGSNTYYLWKVSYTGTCKFIVYCKSDSESGNWYDKKLTGDVDGSNYTTTSYYFDLKNTDKTNNPSILEATKTPFKSLESAEFTSAATSFEAGEVNLTTEFPVAAATNTLSAYNTVSYYVDGTLVSDPTKWNATAGNHSVYAVINSGTKAGETDAYQSAQTETKNFTVSSTVTTHTVLLSTSYDNGKVELVSTSPAKVGSTFEFKVKASDNYAIDTVSLSDGTEVTAGDTDGNGYTHYTFIMPNTDVTINATFKAVATTVTYDVVRGSAQTATSMTETEPGSGIFVSSGTINNGDYFTIRKTYGSTVTYAQSDASEAYWIKDGASTPTVASWTATYSNNKNVYKNAYSSAKYVYYDSNNDQIYLQSTGSGGGTLSDSYFFISTSEGYNWTTSNTKSFKANDDGTYYYVTLTADQIKSIANNNIESNLYFALSSSQSLDNLYHLNEDFNDKKWDAINETPESCSIEKKYNNNVSYVLLQIKDKNVTSVTLKYKYKNASDYIVSAETSTIKNVVEVIAKDATLRTDKDYYSTLHTYGDTYFFTEDSDGNKTYYSDTTTIPAKMSFTREDQKSVAAVSLDEVKKGTTLHIETKNVKSGYYVAGYVVNGETVALFNSGDTPVLDYTIPYDMEADTKIEITPVYFATDSSNCVTFYVEGFDSTVQNTWGNTIACYPYYSGASSQANAFSSYPGQPMLYKDGKYFIQVPRTFNYKKVVGMTLNNYYWDDVHKDIYGSSIENTQSYDFDDFVRIADKQVDGTYIADNIIFSFKFRTKYNNFGYQTPESINSPDNITFSEFAAGTGNGWENLTDHNGNLVNIFGTQLFKTTDDQYSKKSTIEDNPTGNKHLLIVSNGYDENYQGYYATEWTIYAYKNSAYTKVAQIPSSALVLSYAEVESAPENAMQGTNIYNSQLKSFANAYAALNTDEYKNLPAYITYEQNDKQQYSNDRLGLSTGHGGDEGYRCDGRWYYSKINDDIISNVKIQYADSLTGTFTDDSFVTDTNTGTTTQANAYFTNPTAYGNTTCEGKIGQGKFDITTTYSGSEYMFVGWYLEKEGVVTKITNSTNASIEMTGSETYVARYVKVPNGSINISHSLFSNVSDTAAKGAGTLGLQVTLSYDDGTNVFSKPYTYNTSDSSVSTNVIMGDVQLFFNSVKNSVGESNLSTNSFSIKVSLTSIPADKTSLINAYVEDYKNESDSYLSFSTDSNTISSNLNWIAPSVGESMEVSIPFNKIFTGDNNTSITDKVEFFSEFETNPVKYEITYNFTTRLYREKQYKSKGTVSVGEEGLISANGTYSFTNTYIMSVAPDESNFMKTFNWDEASITQSYDSKNHKITVTVNSTQVDRPVHATINLPDVEAKHISTTYGGHFKDNGEFVMAPANNNAGQEFSYWEINTLEGAFVANCYSQYFNYVGYDDYIVTAVYGQGKNTDIYDDPNTSTTVTFLEYSRNHWNDYDSENHPHPDGAPYGSENFEYDRLYADFALAFNYKGILLNETDVEGLKLGYVLDVKGTSTENDLKNGILSNLDNSSFKINGNNVLNYSINRTDLDNKNRVECYYGIKNTDTNRSYNIKVYSYMIVNGEVTLSEQPITICYSGAINE